MKTKEAILALKLGCKVRRESWAPGEWIIHDSSYNNTSSEDGSLYLELEDFIPC